MFALLEGFTHFGSWHGDSAAYVNIVKAFRGTASAEEAQFMHWHGILRPVVPFLALPLSYVISYRDAIATVNLGFLVLGTLFTYLFTKRLLNNEVALVSAMSFASASPTLIFGTAILTDGPGYSMQIILLYFLLFVLEEKKDFKTSLFAGMLIGIGVLTKETSFTVLVFLFLRFLLHKDRLKVSNVLTVALVSIAIPLVWAQLVGYSYLGFYGEGLAYQSSYIAEIGYKGLLVHPRLFALSIIYAFYLCLPFAFLAFFTVDNHQFKTICEILLSIGILLTLWPTGPESRFTFLTFPAILPLAALGMSEASQILARRPWFRMVSQRLWLLLILLATVAYANAATFRLYFRMP
ncbi:MAG: glycosyltransferase family 39 protein [archaeon]